MCDSTHYEKNFSNKYLKLICEAFRIYKDNDFVKLAA